jgi:hypothetical protein
MTHDEFDPEIKHHGRQNCWKNLTSSKRKDDLIRFGSSSMIQKEDTKIGKVDGTS